MPRLYLPQIRYPMSAFLDRDRTIGELRAEFGDLEPGAETEVQVKVAGRLLLIRRQGKLSFGSLRDGTGEVQLFVSQKVETSEPSEETGEGTGEAIGEESGEVYSLPEP